MAAGARAADASVLCRTRARVVVERTACGPRETPISRTALGAASGVEGPAGPAGAAGPAGRQAASIVDAAATRVGPVVYLFELPSQAGKTTPIAFALLDHHAVGGPSAFGITVDGVGAGSVAYSEAGCTGTALVPAAGLLPMLQTVHEVVFYPTTPAPPTVLRSIETADDSGGCTGVTPHGGCCKDYQQPQSPSRGFAVAERTTLAALGLRAPFGAHAE
jgi:hypothetical protein